MSRHEQTAYAEVRPALLTVNDVARTLVVSRDTVDRLVRSGALPTVRVGDRLRFRPEQIDRYLERGSP
jgi:excisionase family DNA binding protein